MSPLYFNPNIKKYNYGIREGFCYTIRKGNVIHKKKIFNDLTKSMIVQDVEKNIKDKKILIPYLW